MTTINRLGGPGRSAGVGRERLVQAGGGEFAVPETPSAGAEAGSVGAAAPSGLIGAMLALQEAEWGGAGNRAARRHGEAMLGELKELQLGLLVGAAEPAALRRLARLAEALPEAADQTLAALVQAVALRARVELARSQIEPE